jgi:hypothetical protein
VILKKALIEALHRQFPRVPQVLCYFHWKQALRKKLNALYITQVGPNGLLELITLIPISEIALGLLQTSKIANSFIDFRRC